MLASFNFWQLLGGLGLFLFAMGQIESALSSLGSKSFKNFLIKHTNTPLKSVLSGSLTTAMLQSSSLVGLLVLAFTGAGLMSLENALGVIFGSNLGTTLTGWIVATIGFKLDLASLSLPLIAVGSIFAIISKGRNQYIGQVLTAIGLLLLGLEFMKDSVGGIAEQFDINTLKDFSAWQFLFFGAIFAAVVQSSSATMIIALAALNGGIITLPSAAALAIGADLGTTSTIIIGASNGTPNKKRVAAAHVVFNLITDLIAFVLLMPLLALIVKIGINNPLYSLVAFHSVFNLIGIVFFLPFIRPFARLLNKFFVTKKQVVSRYLHQITPDVSEAGLLAVRNETSHLIQRIIMLNSIGFEPAIKIPDAWPPLDKREEIDSSEIKSFSHAYHESKLLEGEILLFATDLQLLSLNAEESSELTSLLSAVRQAMHSSKSIKDIQSNLVDFSLSTNSAIEKFSLSMQKLMHNFYKDLFAIKSDEHSSVLADNLIELDNNAHIWHDELHRQILQAIHKREIIETQGSSMLNVNREILNSNLAVIAALNNYQKNFTQPQSEYVEPLS